MSVSGLIREHRTESASLRHSCSRGSERMKVAHLQLSSFGFFCEEKGLRATPPLTVAAGVSTMFMPVIMAHRQWDRASWGACGCRSSTRGTGPKATRWIESASSTDFKELFSCSSLLPDSLVAYSQCGEDQYHRPTAKNFHHAWTQEPKRRTNHRLCLVLHRYSSAGQGGRTSSGGVVVSGDCFVPATAKQQQGFSGILFAATAITYKEGPIATKSSNDTSPMKSSRCWPSTLSGRSIRNLHSIRVEALLKCLCLK